MKLAAFKSSTLLVLSPLLMLGTPALAVDYPTRPIHFIVSFAAGGPNDTIGRLLGQYLSEQLGQPFVIEDRAGAGGNVGMQYVLSAAARWLHHRLRRAEQRHQRYALRTHPIRFRARQHADRRHHEACQCAGCKPQLSGEKYCRAHRHGEGQSGQDQFRLGRRRYFAAYVRRTAGGHGRHQAHARGVSRHGIGNDRSARRANTADVRQSAGLDPADSGRQDPRARRDHGETRGKPFRMSRRSPRPCQATRCLSGTASAGPKACRPKSSTSSTLPSTPYWPTPSSRSASTTLAAK